MRPTAVAQFAPATRNTVKAAMMLGNDVHLLVAGLIRTLSCSATTSVVSFA